MGTGYGVSWASRRGVEASHGLLSGQSRDRVLLWPWWSVEGTGQLVWAPRGTFPPGPPGRGRGPHPGAPSLGARLEEAALPWSRSWWLPDGDRSSATHRGSDGPCRPLASGNQVNPLQNLLSREPGWLRPCETHQGQGCSVRLHRPTVSAPRTVTEATSVLPGTTAATNTQNGQACVLGSEGGLDVKTARLCDPERLRRGWGEMLTGY